MKQEIESKDKEIESKDKEIESKDKEIESKDKEIESKDKEIEMLRLQQESLIMWQQARLHPRRERLGLSMRERSLFRQAFGVFQEAAKEYEAESQADELLAAKRGRASPTKPQRAPPLNEREVNPNHTTRASSPGVVRGHKCALYRESRECREGVPVV